MFATRSKDGDGPLAHAPSRSITERLARTAAVHPCRVVAALGSQRELTLMTFAKPLDDERTLGRQY
jgi:hypothetical protein